MVLLQCVDAKEVEQMLVEVHEGSFGTHANEHAMARKILRVGYYWLIMENDCCIHVRKCHNCQAYADKDPYTVKSSINTSMQFSKKSLNILIIHRWKVPGALHRPKGILL